MKSAKLQDAKSTHKNKQCRKEIKKPFPLTRALKRIKYLGIHLTKVVNDLYGGNAKFYYKKI